MVARVQAGRIRSAGLSGEVLISWQPNSQGTHKLAGHSLPAGYRFEGLAYGGPGMAASYVPEPSAGEACDWQARRREMIGQNSGSSRITLLIATDR